jgi:hypothetical protein
MNSLKTKKCVRPQYPDTKFESDLLAFLHDNWPEVTFKRELEDVARSHFYQNYDPRCVSWHRIPAGVVSLVIDYVATKFEERGQLHGKENRT